MSACQGVPPVAVQNGDRNTVWMAAFLVDDGGNGDGFNGFLPQYGESTCQIRQARRSIFEGSGICHRQHSRAYHRVITGDLGKLGEGGSLVIERC